MGHTGSGHRHLSHVTSLLHLICVPLTKFYNFNVPGAYCLYNGNDLMWLFPGLNEIIHVKSLAYVKDIMFS